MPDIETLRSGTIAEIKKALPTMDRATVVSLLAAEGDQDNPRESLTKLLSERIDAIDADDAADADGGNAPTGPAEWQRADYTGPLDIAQMTWRNANLKPVGAVITK